MRVAAPAKINLSLEILGKRADGYHDIRTLMLPLDLADEIDIGENVSIQLTCDDPTLPSGPENLAWRAAELFLRQARGPLQGASIAVRKRIPHGAGLGGGSSDAAAVLRGLNQLSGGPLSQEELIGLSAELGSDVAFFVEGRPAWCEGRGERLTPADFRHRLHVVLVKPPFPVPTPWAYQRWADSQEVPGYHYAPQESPWGNLRNDLERPVFEKYLVLGEAKSWMIERVGYGLLSGSGSTVLGFGSAERFVGIESDFRMEFGEDWWVRRCMAGQG